MVFDNKLDNELICQNVKRIVELLPIIETCVTKIDLGSSKVYDIKDVLNSIEYLRCTLEQMDSDLLSLLSIIDV